MLIRRVTAHAFGGLVDETLTLADGLTVIHGPNESGKSTWHAALLAALGGRRGAGRSPLDGYRPWSTGSWLVSAEILLADRRRIELRHDLDAHHGVAKDLDLVADYSGEITAKGRGEVPDATRWLGLDRVAFVATACVCQSDLRLATEQANGIRGYVERAAATVSSGETAAGALARLTAFQRETVGGAQRRPLKDASRALDAALRCLDEARATASELSRRAANAHDLEVRASVAHARLLRASASLARAEARRLAQRAAQAGSLTGPSSADPALVPPPPRPRLLLAAAVALVLGSVALLLVDATVAGVVAALAGLMVGALAFVHSGRSAPRPDEHDDDRMRRARLEALLDGGALADLDQRASQAARHADELVRAADELGPVSVSTVDDPSVDLDHLRAAHLEAVRAAALAEQEVSALGRSQRSVGEAESELAAAAAELARLRSLDDVLTRTRAFLERAQEHVHRGVAPTLAAAVSQDLATVTAGRYTETVVDPRSLAVQVRGPGAPLRDADTLSVGTAEQVYLLVRVALAERMVTVGESCPLLLDDVTVHADAARTERILEALLTVASRHQVVLFTQQEQVREWARVNLDGSRHALRELAALVPV